MERIEKELISYYPLGKFAGNEVPLVVEHMDRMIAVGTAEKIGKTWPLSDEGNVDLIYMVEESTEDALLEPAGTIAEIWESNGARNSAISENAKDERNIWKVRSNIYEIFKPFLVDSLDTAGPVAHNGDLLRDIDCDSREVSSHFAPSRTRCGWKLPQFYYAGRWKSSCLGRRYA